MNCHETYLWMLEAEEPAVSPPASVAEHLRACPKCRRRQKRVLRLLTAVEQLPPPPDNPQARAQVLSLVRQTTVAPTPRPPLRSPRRSRRWLWSIGPLVAAAALLLALFGWLFSAFRERPEPGKSLPEMVRHVWNDGDLRTRLLQRDLRLAEAKAPVEQLEALTGMASDLGRESLQQAGRVENADLMRLAVLYERVLRDGVLPRARSLPVVERQARLPALTAELRQTQAEAEQAAMDKPAAAEPLRRLSQSAAAAATVLETPKAALLRKSTAPESSGLLIDTLVVQGLRLAEETDPLKRADVCSDVADSLVRTIVEASKSNRDRAEMVKLGTYLGAMARAAASNLARVDLSNADAQRQAHFQRVRQRADEMLPELQRSAQDAPPPARTALEQAVEASQSQFATLDNTALLPEKPK